MTMNATVYITNRKGGVSAYPVRDAAALEKRITQGYKARLETVAYRTNEHDEREIIGSVEKTPDGKWGWWFDQEAFKPSDLDSDSEAEAERREMLRRADVSRRVAELLAD